MNEQLIPIGQVPAMKSPNFSIDTVKALLVPARDHRGPRFELSRADTDTESLKSMASSGILTRKRGDVL